MYKVRFAEGVEEDLRSIPAYYRKPILEAIRKQLVHEPDSPAKNRKLLANLIPPWEAVPPIWELRVGEYRIFYDVSSGDRIVYVRAIRRKLPGKKTEDIL